MYQYKKGLFRLRIGITNDLLRMDLQVSKAMCLIKNKVK
jgi:hypothetical protein